MITHTQIMPVPNTACYFYLCNNFGKCGPVAKNSLTVTFSDELQKGGIKSTALFFSYLLPHYIAKIECTTMQLYNTLFTHLRVM